MIRVLHSQDFLGQITSGPGKNGLITGGGLPPGAGFAHHFFAGLISGNHKFRNRFPENNPKDNLFDSFGSLH